jgi:voltage-gated potassium channel
MAQQRMTWQQRTFQILEGAVPGDRLGRAIDNLLISLIALNLVALVVETVEPIRAAIPQVFWLLDVGSLVVFSVEYVARIAASTASPKYAGRRFGWLRFMGTPLALIDLLAILPFYLPLLGVDWLFVRTLLLFRLFRVAKLVRYSETVRTFGRVLVRKRDELLTTLFILLLLLLVASSLMFFVENEAQPDKFSSIPASMWWGVATLTTVGYGDVYPITAWGKLLASVISILGIGVCALPTGILGAAFVEELDSRKRQPKLCPHCGNRIV